MLLVTRPLRFVFVIIALLHSDMHLNRIWSSASCHVDPRGIWDQLKTNRLQSSVHANSFLNIAPMGKPAPNEITTCIWFTPSKKV